MRARYDTNVHAPAAIQAALPLLRAQGSGHLVGISSGAGTVSSPRNRRAADWQTGDDTPLLAPKLYRRRLLIE